MNHTEHQGSFECFYEAKQNCYFMKGAMLASSGNEIVYYVASFHNALVQAGLTMTWDISQLEFMCSQGQSNFYHLLSNLPNSTKISLRLRGKQDYYWQQKFLPNVKKILPGTQLFF